MVFGYKLEFLQSRRCPVSLAVGITPPPSAESFPVTDKDVKKLLIDSQRAQRPVCLPGASNSLWIYSLPLFRPAKPFRCSSAVLAFKNAFSCQPGIPGRTALSSVCSAVQHHTSVQVFVCLTVDVLCL